MHTTLRYLLLCALRDRLFLGLLLGVVAATLIASTLGGTALLEEKEMALSYAGGVSRVILAVGLSVFVCFHVRHSFDSREMDVMLSRPLSRPRLVFAHWLGFAVVALLLVLPTCLAIAALGPVHLSGFLAWSVSLLLEGWLLIALALFASLMLKSAVASVMVTLGFYALSRLMAFFVLTADSFTIQGPLLMACKYALKCLAVLVPRLDFFGQTAWLVYGAGLPELWWRFVVQAAVFIPLLLAASALDFQRKEF